MPNLSATSASTPLVCEVCGSPLAGGRLGGQCPACLMSLASSFGLPESEGMTESLLGPLQVRQFGDYELLEEIARGGMGVVFRARQRSLGRTVAIKMILSGELADEETLRMFRTEARAAANLSHPHIVPVYEIGEHEMQTYFTMRLIPGGVTIADWARSRREDSRAIAAETAKVARAVEHAHQRGILHRDLKPSNILWEEGEGPMVTDFGLAKLLDHGDGGMTLTVQAIGSPSYMAPEQMDGRTGEITTVTDVYGIGAVLYELLSGKPPFGGSSALETMRRAAEDAPAALPRSVPQDLRTVCLKCLEKRAADRYSSAAAVAEDLERFVRGEPVMARPVPLARRLRMWALRKPALASLAAAVLLLLVLGIGGVSWQWREARRADAARAAALAHLEWQEVGRWLEEGQSTRALAYLADVIRDQPERWQPAMYAMSILDQQSFPLPAGRVILPSSKVVAGTACLSPDGSWLAAASEDGMVRVWDAATGEERHAFECADKVQAVAVSDGRWVMAVAEKGGRLRVRASPDEDWMELARPASEIVALEFADDGSRMIARTAEAVEVWDCALGAGQDAGVWKLAGAVKGAAVSQQGTRLLLWSGKEAQVVDLTAPNEAFKIEAEKSFRAAACSADGTRVALLDGDLLVRCFDTASGVEVCRCRSPLIEYNKVALNADGSRLVAGGPGNDLWIHETITGLPLQKLQRHSYLASKFAASGDGNFLASFAVDGKVVVWDVNAGKVKNEAIHLDANVHDTAIELSRHGDRLLLHLPAHRDQPETLRVWRGSITVPPRRHLVEGQASTAGGRLSPDGRLGCVSLVPGARTQVFDLETGEVVFDQPTRTPGYAHEISPDGLRHYVCTPDGWIHGWRLDTGEKLWPEIKQSAIFPAALSLDGLRLVTGHRDKKLRVFDTRTGALVHELPIRNQSRSLRFAPDGSGRFVSSTFEGEVCVWDVESGERLFEIEGHTEGVLATAWSPDSRFIATGAYDLSARLWDARTGRPVGKPMPHLTDVSHLEFSPDGRKIATASRDGTFRLWDAATGEPLCDPRKQGTTCQTVRFTADGACVLVQDHEGFQFWETENAMPVTRHFNEPLVTGLGIDAVCMRDIMTPDGSRVFLGLNVRAGALWTVAQPRELAPAWFPDLLDALAGIRFDEGGNLERAPGDAHAAARAAIESDATPSVYRDWAWRVLGMENP